MNEIEKESERMRKEEIEYVGKEDIERERERERERESGEEDMERERERKK